MSFDPVTLTVHRATQQIGGNCIEISAGESRILLDVGRPLDAPREATGLIPATLNLEAPLDGVLISHPHQDHYGLLEETPAHWPVYSGEPTRELIRLTTGIFGKPFGRNVRTWKSGVSQRIGAFTVTPFLTDHSAFELMDNPPPNIDVLLMEGTNLGSDKPCVTEADLEGDFVDLMKETKGRVFVAWSAQNIDRTVTLYRACLKAGCTLVVDLYTAEVLERLAAFGKLPQPGWNNLKVVVTRAFTRLYRRKGESAFVDRMAQHGISARALAATPGKWAIMVRPSLMRDYIPAGVAPDADDAWCWSMWRGYLKEKDGAALQGWFDGGGARARHIHTSGHAAPADLRAFATALSPRCLVPIHGVAWDTAPAGFPPIRRLRDGEAAEIA